MGALCHCVVQSRVCLIAVSERCAFFVPLQEAVLAVLLAEGVPAIPLQLDYSIVSIKTKKD